MPLFLIPAAVAAAPTVAAAVAATTAEIILFITGGAVGGGVLTAGLYKGASWYQERKHKESLVRQKELLVLRGDAFSASGDSLRNRNNGLTVELETLNVSVTNTEENCNRLLGLMDELGADVKTHLTEVQKLNDEAREHHVAVTDVVDEVKPSIEALIDKNTTLIEQLTALKNRLDEQSGIIKALRAELVKAKSFAAELKESNTHLSAIIAEQHTVLTSQSNEIDELHSSVSSLVSQIGMFKKLPKDLLVQDATPENSPGYN